MGYYISQQDSSFNMKKEDLPLALKALKDHYRLILEKNDWRVDDCNRVQNSTDLSEVISYITCFEMEHDDLGNVDGIMFEGEKMRSEIDEVFAIIGPFVEVGSFIQILGEESEMWRYVFDGKKMREDSPTVTWPDLP